MLRTTLVKADPISLCWRVDFAKATIITLGKGIFKIWVPFWCVYKVGLWRHEDFDPYMRDDLPVWVIFVTASKITNNTPKGAPGCTNMNTQELLNDVENVSMMFQWLLYPWHDWQINLMNEMKTSKYQNTKMHKVTIYVIKEINWMSSIDPSLILLLSIFEQPLSYWPNLEDRLSLQIWKSKGKGEWTHCAKWRKKRNAGKQNPKGNNIIDSLCFYILEHHLIITLFSLFIFYSLLN